jgi:D-alanyl-D-alanine carboxypeptidase/D-alanyl-D-alanine-endopeptidase (penicillin-binding protein 4)
MDRPLDPFLPAAPVPRFPAAPALVALLALAFLTFLPGASAVAQALRGLPDPVAQVFISRKLPAESFSAFVQPVGKDTTPLIAFNADTPRNPASTVKLVTTFAALESLGPTYQWRTEVYADGPVRDGVLKGDLIIRGKGDPFLVTERLWMLQRELRLKGLRHIEGDLVVDNTWFAREALDPGAFDGQPYRSYNTLPDALLVNFQSVEFIFRPDPATGRVDIALNPALANLEVRNSMQVFRGNCSDRRGGISMVVSSPPAEPRVTFSGSLASNCAEYRLTRSLPDSASFAYGVFKSLWEEQGGTLRGRLRLGQVPPGKEPFATLESLPLAEVIRPVNKLSNNVMTRQIYLTLGAERFGAPGTEAKGLAAVRAALAARGLEFPELFIDNGAGLSRETRISARSLGRVLLAAEEAPWGPEFHASLSIAGEDGTTRRRFRRDPFAGHMHLKTGSLAGVTAIAGYVHARSGREFAVVAITNHSGPPYGAGLEAQTALLRWLHRQ